MMIKGQRVRLVIEDEDTKLKKYDGEMGFIYQIACKWNPIPVIKLDSGKKLAVEKKHLQYLKQENLFSYG